MSDPNAPAPDGMTEMERAARDFSFGLVDTVRTLAVAMIRAGIVTAADLQRDFSQVAQAVRTDGGSDTRTDPTQSLAKAMAALVPTDQPAAPIEPGATLGDWANVPLTPREQKLAALIFDLYGAVNALADVMVRRNVAPPGLLRAVLLEWAAHNRSNGVDGWGKLTETLAKNIGDLDAAPIGDAAVATLSNLRRRTRKGRPSRW